MLKSCKFYCKWFIYFIFALLLASIFLGLGKWQFERAIVRDSSETEDVKSIDSVVKPRNEISQKQAYQKVYLNGSFEDKKIVIPDRMKDGKRGVWLVQSFKVENKQTVIPIVRGWFENSSQAVNHTTPNKTLEIKGRIMPTEADERSTLNLPELKNVSTAQIANIWNTANIYSCFIVDESLNVNTPKIYNKTNWLNIFYGMEWIFFAGFILFLCFKLMKKDSKVND